MPPKDEHPKLASISRRRLLQLGVATGVVAAGANAVAGPAANLFGRR
jgi:hypothetical protein